MSQELALAKTVNKKANAWVTIVMCGDNYVPGAVVLATSLRWSSTIHDIVCMVTPDVSSLAKEQLLRFFDHVITVPYLTIQLKSLEFKTPTQTKLYSKWANQALTKWRCIGLTQWNKVCFLDADMMMVRNSDHLFDLKAPAGTFSNSYCVRTQGNIKNVYVPNSDILTGKQQQQQPPKYKYQEIHKRLRDEGIEPRSTHHKRSRHEPHSRNHDHHRDRNVRSMREMLAPRSGSWEKPPQWLKDWSKGTREAPTGRITALVVQSHGRSRKAVVETMDFQANAPRLEKKKLPPRDANDVQIPMPKHGEEIPCDTISRALLERSIVAGGCMILLDTSQSVWQEFREWAIHKFPMLDWSRTCYSGKDEQAISAFYAIQRKETWRHISCAYQFLCWMSKWDDPAQPPAILHYMMRKPWTLWQDRMVRPEKGQEFFQWIDARFWWSVARVARTLDPSLEMYIQSAGCEAYRLEKDKYDCFYCHQPFGKMAKEKVCPMHSFANERVWFWNLVMDYHG